MAARAPPVSYGSPRTMMAQDLPHWAKQSISGNSYDVWTSVDTGNTWVKQQSTPGGARINLCADKSGLKFFLAGYNSGIERSLDGGASWLSLSVGSVPNPPPSPAKWRGIATDDTGTTVVAGGEDFGIWISLDGGQNWNDTTYSPPVNFGSYNFALNGDATVLAALAGSSGPIWTVGAGGASAGGVGGVGGLGGAGGTCSNMDFIIRFTIDKTGNLDMNDSIQFKLGWPLGFRGGRIHDFRCSGIRRYLFHIRTPVWFPRD